MYIDAHLDMAKDRVLVVERNEKGERIYKEYPSNYVIYYKSPTGKHRSIYGDPLEKIVTRKRQEYTKEKSLYEENGLFESDVNVVFRCLSDNYLGKEPPKPHVCFFDIETDFERDNAYNGNIGEGRGFAPVDDPFNRVTAITLYLDWLDQCITLAMPPRNVSMESATEMTKEFENCFLFTDEVQMFETFFDLIDDADVLTGWNSEGYDIPYMVNRCMKIMSKADTRKFCLWDQLPKRRRYERFGKEHFTYDLIGRVHLDYLQLYKKYNYESRHSYALNAIGEMEVNEHKVQYEGNLDQLYNNDFNKFIAYNRQDVMLMVKIHNKLKFLDLANALAHENTVLMPTVMGSVAMIEMAIFNEAHSRGMILPNKKIRLAVTDDAYDDIVQEEDEKAAGAYVAFPKIGLHEWIGSLDINSLYPSAIRALNMSPETIVAQLRPVLTDQYMINRKAELLSKRKRITEKTEITGPILWEGLFGSLEYTAVMNQELGTMLHVDYEDGRTEIKSAAEIWKIIFDSHAPLILSANGTIFRSDEVGLIPGLLSRWYSERKSLQKLAKEAYGTDKYEYYDKRQLVRKILLNSALITPSALAQ